LSRKTKRIGVAFSNTTELSQQILKISCPVVGVSKIPLSLLETVDLKVRETALLAMARFLRDHAPYIRKKFLHHAESHIACHGNTEANRPVSGRVLTGRLPSAR
jgi:hypothetical protein